MKRIKLIVDTDGIGSLGDVLDVSDERAARWVARRLADHVDAKGDVATTDEAESPAPKKRGRPAKKK